jgi:hypothetical protein
MRFKVVGANSQTGDDIDVVLEAASQPEVEKLAHQKGILVSSIAAIQIPAHAPAHATHAPAAHAPAHASHAPAAQVPAHASHAPAAHAPAGHPGASHAPLPGTPSHPPKEKDMSSIALIDDEPPAAGGDPNAPHKERAHGLITVNANNPSDTAHTGSGGIDQAKHVETAAEYHVILNQSLFLLESAVNKHLRDGWEPAGGLSVAVINNAPQYFQSLLRRKKLGGAETPPAPAAPSAAPAPTPSSN